MCIQEDASIRPLISDVVTALSYLWIEPDARLGSPASCPSPNLTEENNQRRHRSDITAKEREQAVAEAIAWGSSSRRNTLLEKIS